MSCKHVCRNPSLVRSLRGQVPCKKLSSGACLVFSRGPSPHRISTRTILESPIFGWTSNNETPWGSFWGRSPAALRRSSKAATRRTLNTLGVERSSPPRRVLHFQCSNSSGGPISRESTFYLYFVKVESGFSRIGRNPSAISLEQVGNYTMSSRTKDLGQLQIGS